jgi:hypothetical protein
VIQRKTKIIDGIAYYDGLCDQCQKTVEGRCMIDGDKTYCMKCHALLSRFDAVEAALIGAVRRNYEIAQQATVLAEVLERLAKKIRLLRAELEKKP